MTATTAIDRLKEKALSYARSPEADPGLLSRADYQRAVADLFDSVRAVLKPLTDDPKSGLRIEDRKIELDELGELYDASVLTLRFGPNRVQLRPRGRSESGAIGRVDLLGPAGLHRLVLIPSGAHNPGALPWYVIPADPTALRSLNAEEISELIDSVLPG